MKLRLPLLASLLAPLALASSASAALVADLQAPFTVALTLTRDTNPTIKPISGGHELTTTFQTVRVTARDFLQSLIDEGKIMPPLKGWNLVVRCTTDEVYGLDRHVFAVKAGQPEYALDGAETPILDFGPDFLISSARIRSVGEQLTSGNDHKRFSFSGTFDTPLTPMDLSGLGEIRIVYKPVSLGSASGSVPVPTRVALAPTGGVHVGGQLGGEVYIVEGALTYGLHHVTALHVVTEE